jgi:hypothetical protein
MTMRRVILGLLCLGLMPGCGQGERERGDLSVDPARRAAPLPEPEPPASSKTYAERLADVPGGASEQETLEALLESYCGDCHSSHVNPFVDGAGMNYVDDIDRLIQTGKIIPGDPADSKLVLRMVRGEMPPVSSGLPPAPLELIERLSDFIQSLPPEPIHPLLGVRGVPAN